MNATWYEVGVEIRPVEIARETAHFVWITIPNRHWGDATQRMSRKNAERKYFTSLEAAVANMRSRLEAHLTRCRESFEYAERRMAEFNAEHPPVDPRTENDR